MSFQDASLQDSPITADILERVAAWLPEQERLGSFSLASRSTRAAAVAVTTYVAWWIKPESMDSEALKQQAASLGSYLSSYGRAVKGLGMAWMSPTRMIPSGEVFPPWQFLTGLDSLTNWGVPLPTSSSIHAQYWQGSSMPKDSVSAVQTAGAAEANIPPTGPAAAATATELLPSAAVS
jgi:hypothetical protein